MTEANLLTSEIGKQRVNKIAANHLELFLNQKRLTSHGRVHVMTDHAMTIDMATETSIRRDE